MSKLATRLQGGRTSWNDYQVLPQQTEPERGLLAAIIGQAVKDLGLEIDKGFDLFNPLRVNLAESGGTIPEPAKYDWGAYVAPLHWLLDSSNNEWSFIWLCQHLQLDHFALRKGILKKLGISKFLKLYGLNTCKVI